MEKSSQERRDYEFLKELIREELKPVNDLLAKHDKILNGEDCRGGLIKDVNDVKASASMMKWVIGTLIGILGFDFLRK